MNEVDVLLNVVIPAPAIGVLRSTSCVVSDVSSLPPPYWDDSACYRSCYHANQNPRPRMLQTQGSPAATGLPHGGPGWS